MRHSSSGTGQFQMDGFVSAVSRKYRRGVLELQSRPRHLAIGVAGNIAPSITSCTSALCNLRALITINNGVPFEAISIS